MTAKKDCRYSGRYYDADKTVVNAVEIIFLFPIYIQEIIARGLSLIAVKDFKLDMKLRMIGADNVLALYKSKLKRRKTDSNQNLHNAVNHLRLLAPEERKLVAEKIIDLAGHIDFYLTDCEILDIKSKTKDVTEIRDKYIKQGPEKALEYVNRIREDVINIRQRTLRTEVSFDGGTIHHSEKC